MMKTNCHPIIQRVVRMFRKAELDYNQSKYIFKEVRKALNLLPPGSRRTKGSVKRLSQNDVNELLKAAYNHGYLTGLMVLTLYETGARVNEFVNLEAEDLFWDERRIIIQRGKGHKRREVPITESLARNLLTHLSGRKTGPLFLSKRGVAFTTRRVQQIVGEVGQMAGIVQTVTPHMLRHTRATLLLEKGLSKDMLQQFLGHEKPETTQIYTRTAVLDLDRGFRMLEN